MNFFQSSEVPIHAVFTRHLCAFRKVVDLLIFCQTLIELAFNIRACPAYSPFLVSVRNFSETVVLKCVPYQRDIYSVIELKVVTFVLWFVRSDAHRIDVWSEYKVFLIWNVVDCLMGTTSCLICFIKLAWLGRYHFRFTHWIIGNLLNLFRRFSRNIDTVLFSH